MIVQVRSTRKMILKCRDLLDRVWSMVKTMQDNNMTDCIGTVYAENEIELSSLIKLGAVGDKNQLEQ